jgi:hypothetical protein
MLSPNDLIRSLAASAALALLLASTPAVANRAPAPVSAAAYGSLVDVQILVDGSSAPLYLAPGHWDRRYFQALRGRNYALRVHNRTDRRVGVLISVDGLNVVNGERSNLRRNESMYVLDPFETATIRGWRTSLDEVRRFVFVDEQRSYAERTGQANGDMGWIRVLAFEERRPMSWLRVPERFRGERDRRDDRGSLDELGSREEKARGGDAPAPAGRAQNEAAEPQVGAEKSLGGGMAAAPPTQSFPGTGWGEQRQDPVRETWFAAADAPTDHLVFRYEYASGLRALGIDLEGGRLQDRERGELGFAKPPRW